MIYMGILTEVIFIKEIRVAEVAIMKKPQTFRSKGPKANIEYPTFAQK